MIICNCRSFPLPPEHGGGGYWVGEDAAFGGIMRNKFYITTPIYYVNDQPHIGHAYTTILADVLARYHRMMGVPVFFLTGTDEHGQKVKRAAEKAGRTPKEHADATVVRFQDLWKKLQITNDDFIRTTEERHRRVVQEILSRLYENDDIYRSEYDGWYCVACERYYTEKDLVEGRCPEQGCGRQVERLRESNYFFRMGKYQDWLIAYIEQHPEFIQPDFRRNETLGFLRKKLNDLCVSRPKSRMDWGIELPFDSDYVTYVWFDALVNYISAVGYLRDEDLFSRWWPASYHLIGKDILTTHTVYWPTMLKAMGLQMPECVFAHGWWLVGQDKMSKTKGNVVNPMEMVDRYGADAFRYFLMSAMPLGQDASFSEDLFERRYNADLANDLGNMLSRVMKLVADRCGGQIPRPVHSGAEEDRLRNLALAAVRKMREAVNAMKVDAGLAAVSEVVREANRYLEKTQPWTLARDGREEEMRTVLYCAAEVLRVVGGLLQPVMPSKMATLYATLGCKDAPTLFASLEQWNVLQPGTPVGPMVTLFPKTAKDGSVQIAEPKAVGELGRTAAPTMAAAKAEEGDGAEVEYEQFEKLDLRTARVISAEKVPSADKLLKLEIELGQEKRQIIAGIARHYKPEDLVGKIIVVVANLKPIRIRGLESKGMLLAAADEDAGVLRLVTVDGTIVKSGLKVK